MRLRGELGPLQMVDGVFHSNLINARVLNVNIDKFIAGLMILKTHTKDQFPLCAEHDTIYFGTSQDPPLTETEVAALKELGWRQESEEYDPEAGWQCFV